MDFSNGRIKGPIGYFGLTDWWLSAFIDEERHYIRESYRPFGLTVTVTASGDIPPKLF